MADFCANPDCDKGPDGGPAPKPPTATNRWTYCCNACRSRVNNPKRTQKKEVSDSPIQNRNETESERRILELLAYFYARDEQIFAHLTSREQQFMDFQKIFTEEIKDALGKVEEIATRFVQLTLNQQNQQVQVNVLGAVPTESFESRPRIETPAFDENQLEIRTATADQGENASWNNHISMAKLIGKYEHLPPDVVQYGVKKGMLPASLLGGQVEYAPPSEDDLEDLEID